jgi:uncharacterized protein YqeY
MFEGGQRLDAPPVWNASLKDAVPRRQSRQAQSFCKESLWHEKGNTTMSSLRERFTADLKEAMKAGDKGRVSTIRLITSALKDKDIEARGLGKGETTADELLALLQKMIKQRQESIAIYDANDRPELAAGERAEVEVISSYLPKQMSEDEVKAAITVAVSESGAASVKDMGKVIAILRAKFAGQMDFAKASGLVKAALAG